MKRGNSAVTDGQIDQIQESTKRGIAKKGPKSDSEQKRLADALRANLSRRKDQKKGRKSGAK